MIQAKPPLFAIAAALAGLLVLPSQQALAEQPQGQRSGMRQGPPPEAIAACDGKSADAACSFTGRRGETLNGTCFNPPQQDTMLACRPEGGPPSRGAQ